MSKVSEMSLKSIISKINIKFKFEDINKFCLDIKVAKELQKRLNNGREFQEYLIQNEKYIDKEKLMLISWLNYKEDLMEKLSGSEASEDDYRDVEKNLIEIKKLLKETENKRREVLSSAIMSQSSKQKELIGLASDLKELKEFETILGNMQKIKNISRDMDTYAITIFSKNGILNKINIISSKEEIFRVNFLDKEKENKRICDEIDEKLSKKDEENVGLNYALQCINQEDLRYALPRDITNAEIYKIENNTRIMYEKEIESLKNEELEYAEKIKLENKIREEGVIPQISQAVRDVLKYIDLNKLLLIAIYRFEDTIEEAGIDNEKVITVKAITSSLLEYIDEKAEIESQEVNYTYKDAKQFIERLDIDNGIYISKKEINELKELLLHGENIANLPEEDLLILNRMQVTEDEIEQIMETSKENFAFGIIALDISENNIVEYAKKFKKNWSNELRDHLIKNNKLSKESLISLYYEELINAEFFKEFSEELDISSEVNLQTIKDLYNQIKNNKEKNEEEQSKLDKQIELYKVLNIEGKSQEEIEEASENTMYELAENFDKENKDITFYYENGLLTLNTVAEWTGDSFIEKLYNDSKITFQDLENLYNNKKISQALVEKAVLENQELEYEELMAYIYLGYISENKIEELYMSGKIFDSTLEEIALQGKISPQKYLELTTKRTKEVLEENSKIKLELINIPTKKEINGITINEYYSDSKDTSYKIHTKKNKTLIDPIARYKFLELLGAIDAKAIIPDEDNAFYNYEFFVIPDANGELQANSVVIAERIWEDKKDQTKGLATENATYFFQYKDLMVNSNLSKKEMSQERDKIISTANHRIGSWSVSVLYRIAQTTKSSNLKEYKKGDERATVVIDELLKLYSHEQLKEILNMTKEIDDDLEHIVEEEMEI